MNKIKLVVAITIVEFLGLQYTFIEQPQDPAKDQAKNNQTNNDTNKQKTMKPINKFEFKQLPYSYDALEPSIDKQTVEIH